MLFFSCFNSLGVSIPWLRMCEVKLKNLRLTLLIPWWKANEEDDD